MHTDKNYFANKIYKQMHILIDDKRKAYKQE